MASVILYYILRVRAKTFHEYSGTVPLQYLKTMFAKTTSLYFSKMRQIDTRLRGKFKQKRIYLNREFFLKIYIKEKTMKNVLNRNVAELAHWIIVFSTQKLGICFFDKEILVWGLFSEGFLMPMLRHLIQSQVGMQGILLCRVA